MACEIGPLTNAAIHTAAPRRSRIVTGSPAAGARVTIVPARRRRVFYLIGGAMPKLSLPPRRLVPGYLVVVLLAVLAVLPLQYTAGAAQAETARQASCTRGGHAED